MTPERRARLESLQERLGYRFVDIALLDRALTHASCANEDPARLLRDNEALEFLGDSVLGFVIADLLHRRDPDGDEGGKSKARAQLVAAQSLAQRAAELGLPELLLLGRGEERSGGRQKQALWADAYEATIAALYLDGGFDAAHRFVRDEFAQDVERPRAQAADFKSALQERLQARGDPVPDYVVVEEQGPGHRKRFRVQCVVQGRALGEGEGFSKKEAQQEAARRALDLIESPGEGAS
jgi:ribonuclease-3